MTDLILKTGKVKTCDGLEVRIYATDGGGIYPVHGAIKLDHEWEFETWKLSGSYTNTEEDHRYDLTPIPQPQYFNIYTRKDGATVIGVMKESVDSSVGLGDMNIDFGNVGTFETFRYLNGDITKVEESSNAD